MFSVFISKSTYKFLAKLDKGLQENLRKKVVLLESFPSFGDIQKIRGKEDLLRLRVGQFRIVFKVF